MLLSLLLALATADAAPLKKFDLTKEESAAIEEYNRRSSHNKSPFNVRSSPLRPFSEVEEAGYLFFSSGVNFNSESGKRIMAQNLPAGVTLVVYTSPGDDVERIRRQYSGVIDPSRLKVVEISGANRGFWSRDGLPVPAWGQNMQMELVDAHYYHGFEPDQTMANWFHGLLRKVDYYFEGGNFMPNDNGDCLTVDNNRSSRIPMDVFTGEYGCKRVIRLPFLKGIGHVDEVVRFVGSNIVVTDTPAYAARLKAEGFDVRMLPEPDNEYETYVNALIVNGSAFVPTYGQRTDAKALEVYRAAGLKAYAIESSSLSNDGMGSVHCITMTYPKVPFQQLLQMLNARAL